MNVEPRLFVCPVCGQLQAPDTVDESKPVPPAKPRLCGKCMHRAGLSRRRFLFLGAATGITLAVAPAIALAPPPDPFPEFWYRQQAYLGGLRAGKRALYAHIQLTGPVIAATVVRPGAFMTARNRELQAIAEDIQRQEERRVLRSGRRLFQGRRRGGVQWG